MKRTTTAVAALILTLCTACSRNGVAREGTSAGAAAGSKSEVIALKYADADRVATMIRTEQTGAKVLVQSETNSIVVVGSDAEVEAARRAVALVDRPI